MPPLLPLMQDRDFTCMAVDKYMQDGEGGTGIVLMHSVANPEVPPQPGIVRGGVGASGWVIRPYEAGTQAHVTYALQLHLRHNLPQFVLNQVARDQAMNVSRLKEVFSTLTTSCNQAGSPSHDEI